MSTNQSNQDVTSSSLFLDKVFNTPIFSKTHSATSYMLLQGVVHISSDHVYAQVINHLRGPKQPIWFNEESLPSEEENRNSVLSSIFQRFTEYGINNVIIGLEPKVFSAIILKMPVSKNKDINNALTFEMERHLPLPLPEYSFDTLIIERSRGISSILVLSALKSRLAWILDCAEAADIESLDIRCSSIERFNYMLRSRESKNGLFFDSEGESGCHIKFEGKRILELRIQSVSGILDQAQAHADASEMFVSDIETLHDSTMNKVEIRALDALSQPWWHPRAINLGFRKTNTNEYKRHNILIESLFAIMLILLFIISGLLYYKDSRAHAGVTNRIIELHSSSSHFSSLKKELDTINNKIAFLNKFKQSGSNMIELLQVLSKLLPEDVVLESFGRTVEGHIEIVGTASQSAEIVHLLMKSSLIAEVKLISPMKRHNGREKFHYLIKNLSSKRVPGNE